MSGGYCISQRTFQFIQETLRCYPKVDLFASKKNRLLRKYASVIYLEQIIQEGPKQYRKCTWRRIHVPVLISSDFEKYSKFANEGFKVIMIIPKWNKYYDLFIVINQ
jgi:hypothetical protein